MGRLPVGKRAMTAAERQRRRRERMQLGITHEWNARDQRAWDALELIKVHLDSFEAANYTHRLVRGVWVKELIALVQREMAKLRAEAAPAVRGKRARRVKRARARH